MLGVTARWLLLGMLYAGVGIAGAVFLASSTAPGADQRTRSGDHRAGTTIPATSVE